MKGLRRARHYYEIIKRRRRTADRNLEGAFGDRSARYYRAFWKRAARAVDAGVEDIGEAFLKIRKDDRWTFVQRHWVMLDNCLSRNLVNNKPLIYQLAAGLGWRAPRHLAYNFLNLEKARDFMDVLGADVVVKPRAASRGNGVTTRIRDVRTLREASLQASVYGRTLIVEEFVEGDNYRLLFLDGDFAGAIRREPPTITGDGVHSVRALVQRENEDRLRSSPATSLIPLYIDYECKRTLREQGLNESSVPGNKIRIRLKSVINQNAARENHTVMEGFHPSIIDLGRKLASVLNLKLFGMDLITRDIGIPLNQSGGVINEINTQPGLHYHDLVSDEAGKLRVGELVLDSIFTRTDQRWCS